jgi:hypothetical protein
MFSVQIDRIRRTIRFRATGSLTPEEMRQIRDEATWGFEQLKGGDHIVLADMRGMAAMSPAVANLFGELIKEGRAKGTVCCLHLSDSSIARLQAARLAREASTFDDITTNVISIDEAEKMIDEKLPKLKRPRP